MTSKKVVVKTMSLDEVVLNCRKLGDKVKQDGIVPDHVTAIERAGRIVGYELAKYFKCSFSRMTAVRKEQFFESRIDSLVSFISRNLPQQLSNHCLKLNNRLKSKRSTERNVKVIGNLPSSDHVVLVVDDVIDTGFSMKAVVDSLMRRGFHTKKIKTAVIGITHKNPVFEPDYFLYKGIIFIFPWAPNSSEKKQHEDYLRAKYNG